MNHRINDVVLLKKNTILDALRLLDLNGLRIVFVVDESNYLLGSITDGDIRRGLLSGKKLEDSVESIMNPSPYYVEKNDSEPSKNLKIMKEKGILALAILNHRKLVDVVTIADLLQRKKKDNPVFIMAGGFGTRLKPLTDHCPKPMLPVGGRPLLETIILSLKAQGFYTFYISTHYLPEKIQEHFGDGNTHGIEIEYVHEDEPLGTGGALSLLPKEKIDTSFIVINGDVLTNMDFEKLLTFHEKHHATATMCVREFQYQLPYGVVISKDNVIEKMIEKPSYHFDVNTGIYVISPQVLKEVESEFIGMPSILEKCIEKEQVVMSYQIHEYWLDIGQMDDYNRAQRDIINLDFGFIND